MISQNFNLLLLEKNKFLFFLFLIWNDTLLFKHMEEGYPLSVSLTHTDTHTLTQCEVKWRFKSRPFLGFEDQLSSFKASSSNPSAKVY